MNRSKIHSYDGQEDQYADNTPGNRDEKAADRCERDNRNYRDKERYDEDVVKKTPTPHRSYHEKISSRDRYEKKGVYASTNKCELF